MKLFIKNIFIFLSLNAVLVTVLFFFSLIYTPLDYENAAYNIVKIKTELVRNSTKKNAIIMGGSSVRYGVDTNLINDGTFSYYNLGLYAGYGIEPFFFTIDLIKNDIDRIIIMFEDDLYFKPLNKGSSQSYKFIVGNPDFLRKHPSYIKNLPDYISGQFKGVFKSLVGYENKLRSPENINFLKDKLGNSNFNLQTNLDFKIYPDMSLNFKDLEFDFNIIKYLKSYKENFNIEVIIAFPPLLSNQKKLVIERRNYIKSQLSEFKFMELNSVYSEKLKFHDSRWHLNSEQKKVFSKEINNLLK